MKILLLGGTSDSTAILSLLAEKNLPVVTSVVTDYGRHLASQFGQEVIQGRLNATEMVAVIEGYEIDLIIDATHPFADLVSKEAMQAAELAGVSYLRFERESTLDLTGATVVSSTAEAIAYLKASPYQTIYLGTGSKTLPDFVEGLSDRRLVARVLPTSDVLQACERLGLLADQIHAIKAPFSKSCHKELLCQAGAEIFVSKESGAVGGIRDKIDVCLELGLECLIITRPHLVYPQMVSSLEDLEKYLAVKERS